MPARPVPAYGEQPECDALLGGRYRLRAAIGSGGTADVFRGTDEVLGRDVAVKVFRPGTDAVTTDRFCDEARTLARLSHRALVTVYDVGHHGRSPYMVTELISGFTLRTRMDAGPLSPVHVTRIGSEIASALDHVHAHGIIHHDVKPSNVLLGEGGSPHLADFGLSRTVHERSHSTSDTLVGTLAYMAPEQFLGRGASTASDVYALGLTLLEALTGQREYQGTPVEVGTAHLLHPPRLPGYLPDDLGRLLKAMTDQDPQARPDAARVHLLLQETACARAPRAAAASRARTDTSTHRSPVPPPTAAPSAPEAVRASAPAARRAPIRRRAAAVGLAAVSVAGACTLLVGGSPAPREAPPAPVFRNQPQAPREADAAGARPAPPVPSAAPVRDPAAAPPSARPGPAYARQQGGGSPPEHRSAKAAGSRGEAKGRKDRARPR